ncbi:hypothetical protein BJ165DRAFT_756550 [Panaeolus papilionaceus]|nr:hypothetical protein BJ165DRAFT_756550 [Panaeolus papilionaceus]
MWTRRHFGSYVTSGDRYGPHSFCTISLNTLRCFSWRFGGPRCRRCARNAVVGCCRSIGWGWGKGEGRRYILGVVSRLGTLGIGGGCRKLCGMRVGREEVAGKEKDEGVRVDTDWSHVPAFMINTRDVSIDWDWIFFNFRRLVLYYVSFWDVIPTLEH